MTHTREELEMVCIHGGKSETVQICSNGGWYYGYQFGSTCYGVPYMIDYVSGSWGAYVDALRLNRPRLAVVMDYRSKTEADELHQRCMDVARLNIMPVVVAKFAGCLATIRHTVFRMPVRIGISTPTKRGYMNEGYIPTAEEIRCDGKIFPHRHIHLLGGHPDQWLYLMRYYARAGAIVASIDGNVFIEQARSYGKMWSRYGYYRELRGRGHPTWAIAAASMRNARRYLDNPTSNVGASSRVQLTMQALGEIGVQHALDFSPLKGSA